MPPPRVVNDAQLGLSHLPVAPQTQLKMLLSSRILRHTRLFSTSGTRLWSVSLQRIDRIALGVYRGVTWDRRWFHLISGDRRRSDRCAQRSLGATSHKSVRCDSRRCRTRDKSTRAYCSPLPGSDSPPDRGWTMSGRGEAKRLATA